jgi:ABC-2 type transport system ATP-binding protein
MMGAMNDRAEEVAGVEATSLTKAYGPVRAVRGVDLSIAAGETVALLGPNGAGKSTTIDMILGLTHPDEGSVTVFGSSPVAAVRAGKVGGMLQGGAPVDHLRVRELVALVASYYPHPMGVAEVLAMTGCERFARQMTSKLSGGQSQRVRFATAIVGDPDLLVLDEPTAAIDVEGRHEFWAAMRGVAERGKTVLFATHYLEEANEFADRIVIIARGVVVADGPATDIKALTKQRTIRATLPGANLAALAALSGVESVDRHGDTVILSCSDPDAALEALYRTFEKIRDVEVTGASLEEAFMALTADDPTARRRSDEGTEVSR